MNKHTATVLNFNSSFPARTDDHFHADHNKLAGQHFVVLMPEAEVSNAGDFLRFLNAFRPKVILDLRLSPRLDFVGGSRRRAFHVFEEFSVQYVDVLGRLGVSCREDFLRLKDDKKPTLLRWISSDPHDDRPIVCLYDDASVVNQCEEIFRDDIQSYRQSRPATHVSQFRAGLLAL